MESAAFAQMVLVIFASDLLRYLLAAGSVWLLVHVAFKRPLAGRRILDGQHRAGQISREITYSIGTVVIFASVGVVLFLGIRTGRVPVYEDVALNGWAWWIASLLLIVAAHDAYFYWTHRLLHHPRLFAWVHARHHASRHPTPWAAYAFHPAEALLEAAFFPLYLLWVPTHEAVLGIFLLHMVLRNAVGHCGHELFAWSLTPRGALGWITPVTHHHFHHARNQGNYGLYFTWWDRWCDTEDKNYLAYGDERFLGVSRKGVHA